MVLHHNITSNQYSFLSGGGEMGALMRSKDWSASTVGTPDKWPQSLRTTLGIILNSRFPMFLFWGKELTCFYNDAYRPSLGKNGKHPSILGQPGNVSWPDIWDVIKPLIDQVLAGGEATWSEDQLIPIYRNGTMEDVYWTFSYSPVTDETGNVAGVFVTCSETTEKVRTLQSLKEREDQLNFVINAAELATWDIYTQSNRFIGNNRMKQWFGLESNEDIQLAIGLKMIAKEDRKKVIKAINKALDPGNSGNYEIEYNLFNPLDNKKRCILSKGKAVFDENNIPIRFSGISEDITEKKAAAQKATEHENRFRNTVRQATVGISLLMGPDFIVETANEFYLTIVGKTEKDFVGRPLFDSLPEVRETVEPLLKNVLETGLPYAATEFPVTINRYGNSAIAYFNFTYQAFKDDNDDITGVMVVAIDVTEMVNAKHALADSEKQFREMIMHSPIPMTILRGSDFIIETANKAILEKMWRKKEEDVIGKKLFSAFPELTTQKFAGLLQDVFTSGKTYWETEAEGYLAVEGVLQKLYLDFEYAPLFGAHGKVSGVMITINDVTQKVEARKQAEEREREFRQLANSIPALIWTTDPDGQQVFVSDKWNDFTGLTDYSPETFTGIIHPDDVDQLFEHWSHSLKTGDSFRAQARLKNAQADYEWFFVNGEPIRNKEGKIEKWVGAFTNLNEQKKTEQELLAAFHKIEENEKTLNIVIEASELGMWRFNFDSTEPFFSDRYLEIFGHPKGTKLSLFDARQQLHPEDVAIRNAAHEQALDTGILLYEARITRPDGSMRWIEAKGKAFYDSNGKPHHMIGTVRDITKEKNQQEELEDRERKFRLLANSMPQLVWTGDANGKINYYNQSMYNYTGLAKKELVNNGWLQVVHPDEREKNVKAWEEAVRTGTDYVFEHRFIKADGEYRWHLSRAIPQRDAEGNIRMWVGTSTDIQEMKELDQQKDLFIGMASHELKTPITTVKGYVQLLQSMYAGSTDTFLQHSLSAIDRQIITLTKLISDLLDVSKIKSGSLDLNRENFEINTLVEELVTTTRQVNPSYSIELSLQDKKMLYADKERIGQVLINLLTNAIKYSPDSKTIKVTVKPAGNEVSIAVQDSGIGINKTDQEKIFERFYRVEGKNEKRFSGFGIGLFIASEIVQKHNGKIWVCSEEDKGSTFYFSIPAMGVQV